MRAKILTAWVCLISFVGCVTSNPVSEFYVGYTGDITDAELSHIFQPPSATPRVINSSDIDGDLLELEKNGYGAIGDSSFTWTQTPSLKLLQEKALEVSADVVLYSSGYSHTETGTRAMVGVIPGSSTTTSTSGYASANSSGSASASAYGSGGYAYGSGSYSGSGAANYYGTETTTTAPQYYTYNVPYSQRINEYSVIFMRKLYPPILGARTIVIPDELRAELGRNTGAYIWLVDNNSPAFHANLVAGDIIIGLNENEVPSPKELSPLLKANAGKEVQILILRHGNEEKISVKLDNEAIRSVVQKVSE